MEWRCSRRSTEIMSNWSRSHVPQMPAHVKGVVNLRGKIIPVMDLRVKFGMSTTDNTDRTCIIVVQVPGTTQATNALGLVVDSVEEVLNLQRRRHRGDARFRGLCGHFLPAGHGQDQRPGSLAFGYRPRSWLRIGGRRHGRGTLFSQINHQQQPLELMKQKSIGARVFILSGFLCAVIAGLGIFSMNRFASLNQVSKDITEDSVPGIVHAARMRAIVADNQIRAHKLFLVKTAAERQSWKAEIEAADPQIVVEMKSYGDSIFSPEDRKNFEDLTAKRDVFLRLEAKCFTTLETNRDDAVAFMASDVRPAYQAYAKAVDVLVEYNSTMVERRGVILAEQVRNDIRLVIIIAAAALLIGLSVSVLSAKSISKALNKIASALGDGSRSRWFPRLRKWRRQASHWPKGRASRRRASRKPARRSKK